MAFLTPVAPVVLDGEHARMEPLALDHVEGLARIALDPDLWTWGNAVPDVESLRSYVAVALAEREAGVSLPFATLHRASGRAAGSTRFTNISPEHRRAEIGFTWLGKPYQRTALNTEAKLLMLTHAFETWGCIRVEFKADARNEPSRAAMERIGAKYEGTLRAHMLIDNGRIRDSVYYSILEAEWPAVKAGLQAKLAAHSA